MGSAWRLLLALGLLAGSGVLLASPAAADPAGPTNDRSRILSIEPRAPGAEVRVVGGDAFLRLTIDRGHKARVPGYRGEPYIRFLADGGVEVNRRSPAAYLNEDRRTGGVVPAEASSEGPPRWERVADGGDYAWHDHRIHWMGEGRLGEVRPWQLDLDIDGRAVRVRGELVPLDAPLPVAPLVVAAAVAAASLWLGRRATRQAAWAVGLTLAAAALATVLGWADWFSEPPGVGASVLVGAAPTAAVLLAVVAALVRRSGRDEVAGVLLLAATAVTAGWAVLHLPALWHAIIPSTLPSSVVRAGLAVTCGLLVAAAVLALRMTGDAMGRRLSRAEGAGLST